LIIKIEKKWWICEMFFNNKSIFFNNKLYIYIFIMFEKKYLYIYISGLLKKYNEIKSKWYFLSMAYKDRFFIHEYITSNV
jgi:hypothetical protein